MQTETIEKIETAEKNHPKADTTWSPADDLKLLKNWNQPDHVLGQMLGRTNYGISSRRVFLRKNPKKVVEIRRTFPEAQFIDPNPDRKVRKKKKDISSFTPSPKFENYYVPQHIIDKYDDSKRLKEKGRPDVYTLKEQLFIAENLNMNNSSLGNLLGGRTKDAISVKKSQIRKQLRDPRSNISKAIMEWKNAGSVTTPVVDLEDHTLKTFTIPFSDVTVDWNNKKLVFKLEM